MMKHTFFRRTAATALCLLLVLSAMAAVHTAVFAEGTLFHYRHDPRLNARAMEDVIVDPAAVYGFSPNPNGSLAAYAAYDWTDAKVVEEYRQNRLEYLRSYDQLYDLFDNMAAEGRPVEETARAVSAKRNELRLAAAADDPEQLALVKARNLEKYGHEDGPTADEVYAKYGSWETVIEKAFSHNSGMDACVGLYDDYYDYYLFFGYIEEEGKTAASREYAVAAFIDAAGLGKDADVNRLAAFADAKDVSAMFAGELAAAVEGGVIKGYEDGTLRPQATVRRIEALTLLSRILPNAAAVQAAAVFSDVPAWAKDDIDRLSAAGIVEGYGNGMLGADDLLTVEQVALLLARIQK